MPEIIDLDALVPDDIQFKYREQTYTIPGDLRVDDTLHLYALLVRLANAEAKGTAAELKRILGQAEAALLPIFQVHQPDMSVLPFGAAGLGHVLRKVLELIGMLEVGPAVDPPGNRAQRRAAQRSTPTRTKRGSGSPKTAKRSSAPGSTRSKSS